METPKKPKSAFFSSLPPIKFPPELLKPSPTQIDLVLDEATRVVEQLDDRARHLGSKFGIPMHQWALKERSYGVNSQSQGWEIAVAVLAAAVEAQEFVGLEKHDGWWGLYYTRQPPPLMTGSEKPKSMPLRDAPVEVRMKFLERSEAFFRQYIDLCKNRLAEPNQSIAAGKATLELLDHVESE